MLWDADGTAYVSQWLEPIEETMHYFYARLTPGDAPALFRRLALDAMNDSSDDTFVEVASQLPDTLQNERPDLIDQATVRQGCRRLMAARAEFEDNPWSALRQRLDGRREAVASDQELSDADRERILDAYFARCYAE
ncbi:MAG: hypothetical protein DCC57_15180 [Chloroflexi bacterium]|nr:MAG: hypothetical protein DCC57_15180 [Chloroflexota bacterium]